MDLQFFILHNVTLIYSRILEVFWLNIFCLKFPETSSSSSTNPSQGFWQKKEPSVLIQVSPFGHISYIVSIKNHFILTNRVAKSVSFRSYLNNNSRYTSADIPADWVLWATRISRVTRRYALTNRKMSFIQVG